MNYDKEDAEFTIIYLAGASTDEHFPIYRVGPQKESWSVTVPGDVAELRECSINTLRI